MPTADELLGPDELERLICIVGQQRPQVPLPALERCRLALGPLGLRQRADLIAAALLADLPGDFEAFERLVHRWLEDPSFTGWATWPVSEAVVQRALGTDADGPAFEAALHLLAELTPRLTAEFAIRPLLSADLDRAMVVVRSWTAHPDEHVRRLASEGTRPFLPWSTRVHGLAARPELTLPVLDALYRDATEYVRRSVANHLNDLSRNHATLVVATAERWMANGDEHTPRLVRHGLRTLVKQGHPGALAVLGYAPAPWVHVDGPLLGGASVRVGEHLAFTVVAENRGTEATRLAIDYVVHHRKARGDQRPKVFKLTTRTLQPGESITVTRRHSFRPISTRVYHPGEHAIEIQVNGSITGRSTFDLHT